MNKHALYHKSDSLYAFPLDGETAEIRLRTAHGDARSVKLVYGVKHGFCKTRSAVPMNLYSSDGLFDYYIVRLKLVDKRLAYVFLITDVFGKEYYYSEDGATETYDFSKSYYNFFQLAYLNPNDIQERVDWLSSAVVYQIFVDRFDIGNNDGKKPVFGDGYVNMEWGDKPTPKSFAGGNLDGIRSRLDYLTGLGVNTLYLTPIFTSRSNHKYDISDYYNVDPHFGGNAAFEQLMNACKAKGVRVILDAVFNHCSEDIDMFRDVKAHGRQSPYHDFFVIRGDYPTKRPLDYDVFADCDYMPKWNTANPEVRKYLCGIGKYWIENYGIDGWRLDVSDEVSHGFWREFRTAIKSLGKDIVLIGENWHDSRSYLRGDQFDSIMNYAFTKCMTDYFCDGSITAQELCDRLSGLIMRNTTQVNSMMLNLIDSHDTHRFYSLCGKNAQKLLCALAVEVFMPGAAMVYYGTEIPLEGGYDPDSRRCFDWSGQPLVPKVKEILKYKKLRALVEGDVSFRVENGLLVMERKADGQKATLIVNNTDGTARACGKSVAPQSFAIIVE